MYTKTIESHINTHTSLYYPFPIDMWYNYRLPGGDASSSNNLTRLVWTQWCSARRVLAMVKYRVRYCLPWMGFRAARQWAKRRLCVLKISENQMARHLRPAPSALHVRVWCQVRPTMELQLQCPIKDALKLVYCDLTLWSYHQFWWLLVIHSL